MRLIQRERLFVQSERKLEISKLLAMSTCWIDLAHLVLLTWFCWLYLVVLRLDPLSIKNSQFSGNLCLNYLANQPNELYVTQSLTRLLVKVVKLGWFESVNDEFIFRKTIDDAQTFLKVTTNNRSHEFILLTSLAVYTIAGGCSKLLSWGLHIEFSYWRNRWGNPRIIFNIC